MFTRAEAAAAALVSFPAAAIVLAYGADAAGLAIHPLPILALALVAAAGVGMSLRPRTSAGGADLVVFFAVVSAMTAWLLWLAWPHLLPIGGGSDLTHHLLLIDYIDRSGRLVHDPALAPYLGEMLDYTPGAHLLAVLAGRWTRTDGLHAVYAVVALSVALKCGIVFLIARRCTERLALAIIAPLLLFLPSGYFLGSFTHDSFLAQVVAEMFAVAMWWGIVCWDQEPNTGAAAIVGIAGAATFLTWPVWSGPMIVTLAGMTWLSRDRPNVDRLRHVALALVPTVAIAALHAAGRFGTATMMAGASGFALVPSRATMGWLFPLAGLAGIIVSLRDRRARTVPLLLAAIGLQAAALVVVARMNRAEAPYLALKMFYLAIYPLAVAGAVACGAVIRSAESLALRSSSGARAVRSVSHSAESLALRPSMGPGASRSAEASRSSGGAVIRSAEASRSSGSSSANGARGFSRASPSALAWTLVLVTAILAGRSAAAIRRPTPAISNSLLDAGRWARAHVPPACIDYLVADDDSAYWLHVVVLGNPRAAKRSLDPDTYEPQKALVRWILPDGLPYAIVEDVDTLPRDILTNVDVLERFAKAAVVERRGKSSCAG